MERILSTDPENADTDQDLLTDQEVAGFVHGGRQWYTDPLEADTNGDGAGDGVQWDANGDGVIDDTDADDTPDVFDDDDDGDGVPDKLDLSPNAHSAITATFTLANPFSLILENLTPGRPTYVEFQVRPTNPDHLWYAYNVLDWPTDRQGQMQDGDGATFWDLHPDAPRSPNENGDLKLVPMLEIRINGSPTNLPPQSELNHYGVSVVNLNADGSAKVVYVPLQLTTESQGGARVAFYAKMLYLPADTWGAAQQVRMVWMLNALVDLCKTYTDGQCTSYEKYNQEQPIFTYGDEWILTGLNVREDHGVDVALAARIARLERALLLHRLQRAGVQVVDWQAERPFDQVVHTALVRLPHLWRTIGVE